jgi:hypothetical protein
VLQVLELLCRRPRNSPGANLVKMEQGTQDINCSCYLTLFIPNAA